MRLPRFLFSAVLAFGMVAAAPAGAGPFDGTWIVSTRSNRPNCGGNTNEMTVADGRVSGQFTGKNGVYAARGKISDDGKVRFNLDAGYVTFKGRAEGDTGDGTWAAARHCRGSFTMTRK